MAVVGAGPAGMRASYELVQQGFKVYLVEEKPTIGGKMAQIDKVFPTNECATCTILPHMLQLTSNPNIKILAFSDVESVEGVPGDFRVKIIKKPRYVDPLKCTACTDCFSVCPIGKIPKEFNFGRGFSKAISFYSPFPPRKALINPGKCNYIRLGKCGDTEKPPCIEVCKPKAIDFLQKPQEVEIQVGAIILATGVDEVKNEFIAKYGYGKLPNVLTALEYERLLSGLGPTQGTVRRDDGEEPQSVAWLVLDNSSPIGFMTAVAEALGTFEKNSNVSVSIIHEGVSFQRESYNKFYLKAKDCNINFIQTNSVNVTDEKNGSLTISYDKTSEEKERLNVEMLVLAVPLSPSLSTGKLAQRIGVELGETGDFKGRSEDLHPIYTSREGIFVCGSAQKSKGIDDSIIQACSAAANAAALLASSMGKEIVSPPEKDLLPVKPEDKPETAVVICRCGMNIAGLLHVDELAKYVASLPHVNQVEVTPFGCDGVKIKELLKSKRFNRIVIGACSPKTHESLFELHTESGGLNRNLMEIVNLRNQCTWVHSKDKGKATEKAKTLMRIGVNRNALLEPLEDIRVSVTPSCLVIGGNASGIACALKLAKMGLQVHIVESENDLNRIEDNPKPFVKTLLDELKKNENVKIYTNSKVGGAEGFIGNYKVEIVKTNGREKIEVGSIVIATRVSMCASSNGNGYEKDLALQRNEKSFFIGMLGILNPLDFNTEGVFMCGSARAEVDGIEAVVEGEGAASRVAGIISKKEIVKSPWVSFVVDEKCDGCAFCVEPCPANAITLIEYMSEGAIKKTVEVNEVICRGCGICMATCPKEGIFVRHFSPEQFRAMIKSIQKVA